uniref:Uncharacterized protein n=1 Tax=Arundo donax TaxID=35708 RepID=A0A0A9AAE3_ARUDO
MLVREWGARL